MLYCYSLNTKKPTRENELVVDFGEKPPEDAEEAAAVDVMCLFDGGIRPGARTDGTCSPSSAR